MGGNKFKLNQRVNITESSPARGEETTMTKVFSFVYCSELLNYYVKVTLN